MGAYGGKRGVAVIVAVLELLLLSLLMLLLLLTCQPVGLVMAMLEYHPSPTGRTDSSLFIASAGSKSGSIASPPLANISTIVINPALGLGIFLFLFGRNRSISASRTAIF
ncbi:hypothetical protein GGR51DRAFT_435405 [Nemania sp. FL0031]|nr:hypothetical protein GGR51DRAFT_435405 [Nemania sp. FL0031]